MSKHILSKMAFAVLVIIAAVVYFGCEKKTDTKEQPTDGAEPKILVEDTTPGKGNTEVEQGKEIKTIIQDLKGTWIGTFDKRSTVLNITEQTDSSFSGKISIKYRETINQDVKGTFRPATRKVSMEDQIHSKYMGKYDGKLSDDGKNLSGTFTMNRNGTKSSFNLNKK
jgi:hypothetical protein